MKKLLNKFVVPILILVIIAFIWIIKYSDFPMWLYFSVTALFCCIELVYLFISRINFGEKFVKFICVVLLLYSILVPLTLSLEPSIGRFLVKLGLTAQQVEELAIQKFLLSLPSVGWALFLFTICSIALSLHQSEKWQQLISEEIWFEKIKCFYKNHLFCACGISLLVLSMIIFLATYDMEYDYRMFFACIPVIVISIILGTCLKSNTKQQLVVFVLLVIAGLNWILVSYESYYSGVERRLGKEAKVAYYSTANVLNSSLPEDRKLKEIENIHASSDAEIVITREVNGDTNNYYVKNTSPNKENEYLLTTFSEKFEPIVYNREVFTYKFSYFNRPKLDIGLARAVSFSTFPNYLKDVTKNSFSVGDNGFVGSRNYKRSTNFWVAFWLLYMFSVLVMYYKQNRDELITEKDNAIKKLKEFDLMYHKTFDDFNKVSVIDSKQHLQRMNLNWGSIIEEVLADERHGLKNKLTKTNLTELEQELYDKLFKDFQETILTHLRDLPKVLDYHLTEETIEEIIKNSKSGIPENYHDVGKSGLVFSEFENVNASHIIKKCNVNKYRIASIVHNLLTNSGQAIGRKVIEKLLQGEAYEGAIQLFYSIKTFDNKEYLSIRVKDNAGGFPQDIIAKVYQEPIYSSDENNGVKRFGKGTMYVHYFAELMKAKILVGNEKFDEENNGAVVEILVPIIEQ